MSFDRTRRAAATTVTAMLLVLPAMGCPAESSPSPAAAPTGPTTASSTAPVAPRPASTTSTDSPYPPVDASCSKDADCDLIGTFRAGTTGCCTKCGEYTAGTRAWVASALAACHAKGPCEMASSCAEPTTPAFVPVCSAGRCTVSPRK